MFQLQRGRMDEYKLKQHGHIKRMNRSCFQIKFNLIEEENYLENGEVC